MKKVCLLFVLAVVFAIPQQSMSQSLEDYYNAGYILGASIRQAVDNSRARKAEQERLEMERLEAERRYELEQQRIANERYAIQQREAEARRAEEERLRIAQEAKKAEEERLRLAQEAQRLEEERLKSRNNVYGEDYGAPSIRPYYRERPNTNHSANEYNSNVQILSSNNSVKFLTDDGEAVYLYVLDHSDGGTYMSYYNHDSKERRLSCNRVTLKVKYAGDDDVQTITDACSFIMPANRSNNLEWSDVFFNISETKAVESIKVSFVETQIR